MKIDIPTLWKGKLGIACYRREVFVFEKRHPSKLVSSKLFIDCAGFSGRSSIELLRNSSKTTEKSWKVRRMVPLSLWEGVRTSFASNNYATDVESLANHYTSVVTHLKTWISMYPVESTSLPRRQWNHVVCKYSCKPIVSVVAGSNTPGTIESKRLCPVLLPRNETTFSDHSAFVF